MRAIVLFLLVLAAAIPAPAQDRIVDTQAGRLQVRTIASGFDHPWGIAELPDGRLLVTEREGRLRLIGTDGKVSDPVAGVPKVYASGQGGLLDITLAPDFAQSGMVFFSYAEEGQGGAGTAVARGRLVGPRRRLSVLSPRVQRLSRRAGPAGQRGDGPLGERAARRHRREGGVLEGDR